MALLYWDNLIAAQGDLGSTASAKTKKLHRFRYRSAVKPKVVVTEDLIFGKTAKLTLALAYGSFFRKSSQRYGALDTLIQYYIEKEYMNYHIDRHGYAGIGKGFESMTKDNEVWAELQASVPQIKADIIALGDYFKTNKLKTRAEYESLSIFGNESEIVAFIETFPKLAKYIINVSVPSCPEAEDLLNQGIHLTQKVPEYSRRAFNKPGYYDKDMIAKIVNLADQTKRFSVNTPFKQHGNRYGIYLNHGVIMYDDPKDIMLVAMLDPKLVHKSQEVRQDPGSKL